MLEPPRTISQSMSNYLDFIFPRQLIFVNSVHITRAISDASIKSTPYLLMYTSTGMSKWNNNVWIFFFLNRRKDKVTLLLLLLLLSRHHSDDNDCFWCWWYEHGQRGPALHNRETVSWEALTKHVLYWPRKRWHCHCHLTIPTRQRGTCIMGSKFGFFFTQISATLVGAAVFFLGRVHLRFYSGIKLAHTVL